MKMKTELKSQRKL